LLNIPSEINDKAYDISHRLQKRKI